MDLLYGGLLFVECGSRRVFLLDAPVLKVNYLVRSVGSQCWVPLAKRSDKRFFSAAVGGSLSISL